MQRTAMRLCALCGAQFTVTPKLVKNGQRLCSRACADIGRRKRATPEAIATKFWASVDRRGPDECWPWKLVTGSNGYGLLHIGSELKQTAHRISYELHFGPIPALDGTHGGCVLHKCDNRRCVNPAHLFLGTQGDNLRDMWAKGRGYRRAPPEDSPA